MTLSARPLHGRRILIVEDDVILAMDLEALLEDAGAEILGPAPSVPRALELVSEDRPEAATLDMNLGGRPSLPVAHALRERDIPFVVVSGYSESYAEEHALRDVPFVKKPVELAALIRALESVIR